MKAISLLKCANSLFKGLHCCVNKAINRKKGISLFVGRLCLSEILVKLMMNMAMRKCELGLINL